MSKKLVFIALLFGTFGLVGCGKNQVQGNYTGTNSVNLVPAGGNGGYNNTRLFQTTVAITDAGSNTLTGTITSTSSNNLGGAGSVSETANANVTGTREGNNLNAQNVLANINMNGYQCIAVLTGTLNSNPDGTILTGTLTGPAQYQYGGDCGTATFQLNVARTSSN